jgi:acetate kinase
MRELLARDDVDARLALGVYVHRLRAGIAAMAAALGGIDALVFTGGVGERAPRVRELACEGLQYMGIRIDRRRNATITGDGDVAAYGALVHVLVVHAREDVEIARETRGALSQLPMSPVSSA